jgi:Cd2+/Zn2+-exporting ATPase
MRRIVMLSGDNTATAQAIAAQTGIPAEDVRAELLPEGKVAAITQLVAEHQAVAMVGDGVNDAPALAAATVGIAMGAGGSDTALETADVALVADDLTRLPWVLQLSRRAARTIRVNVAFALTTKFVVLGLAALGIANLWLAIAADTGASIVVILNSMRLLGRMPLPKAADAARLRRRYGLEEEDEHAGHSH